MPESNPISQWPTGEFKKRRLELRADIEAAIGWRPVDRAIELVARRRDISLEDAWDAIKLNISLGQLRAQCIDDRGERVAFAPHWIELLAKFQLPTESGTLDQPIGTVGEFLLFSDFPSGGILWFDRRRAVENRLARKITEDNRTEPSLPPTRVRDVVVDAERLDELYPENAAASEETAEASAQTEVADEPGRLPADGEDEQTLTLRRLTIKAEKNCLKWLLTLMKKPSEPTKNRDEYRAEAIQSFGVGKRSFKRAWDTAIRETGNLSWNRPGRKSKRRIDTPV